MVTEWNVNGWSYKRSDNVSSQIKRDIIDKHGSDIYSICETHLCNDDTISVDGYQWFGHNRTVPSGRAISGSGGVWFLISHEILKQYKADVTDKSTKGILWLTLTMKDKTDIGLLLCVCYLPSEGSSRGNVSQEFYDCLVSQLYLYYDGNPAVILGDYNGRIGMKGDCYVPDIPCAMSRTSLGGSLLTLCVISLEII